MTTYTTIPDSDIDPESPITSTLITRLRDNAIAIKENASGSPAEIDNSGANAIFTQNGIWNKPSWLSDSHMVFVQVWGAGGGGSSGGSTSSITGGGGGGGAYQEGVLRAGDLASQVTVTVAAGANIGAHGGKSSFHLFQAFGGGTSGGSYWTSGGGGGGSVSGGGVYNPNSGFSTLYGGTGYSLIMSSISYDQLDYGGRGSGISSHAASASFYGGGGGGSGYTISGGAVSAYGGGGGGGGHAGGQPTGQGGISRFGGNGGNSYVAGGVPAGGGGAHAAGARGEVRVFIFG